MALMPGDPGLARSSFWMPVLALIAPQFWGPFPAQGAITLGYITMTVTASTVPYPAANARETAGGLQGEFPSTSQKEPGTNGYGRNTLPLLTQPLPSAVLRAGVEHSLSSRRSATRRLQAPGGRLASRHHPHTPNLNPAHFLSPPRYLPPTYHVSYYSQ